MAGLSHAPAEPLSVVELAAVAAAVGRAESLTSAEIRIAVRTRPLRAPPLMPVVWAALVALLGPWLLVLVPALSSRTLSPLDLLSLQALIFVGLSVVLMLPPLARRVVPKAAYRAAAREAALDQFLAHGIAQTDGRTGILIYIAVEERLVEVVADSGVHEALGHAAWSEICAAVASQAGQGHLAAGLIAAAERAGELLAGHLPREAGDADTLSNHVILM